MGKFLTAGLAAFVLAAAPAFADDEKPAPAKPAAAQPDDKKPGAGRFGGADRAAMIFKRLDTNGDGKLSLDEFKRIAERGQGRLTPERAEQIFRRLDTNKDGFLTPDELKAFAGRLRQRKP